MASERRGAIGRLMRRCGFALAVAACLASGQAALAAAPSPSPGTAVTTAQLSFDPGGASTDAMLEQFRADAGNALALLRDSAGKSDKETQHEVDRMRDRLASDRARALTMGDRGTLQTRLIQAEIDALGPAPKVGETEPPALAAKRRELEDQLGLATLPVLRWREAQARANALITELDDLSSAMTRTRLLVRDRSPLDPRLWISAAGEVGTGAKVVAAHFDDARARIGLFGVVGSVVLAVLLIALPPFAFYKGWNRLRVRMEGRIIMSASIGRKMGLAILLDAVSFVFFALALGVMIAGSFVALSPLLGKEGVASVTGSILVASLLLATAQWLGRSVLLSPIHQLRLVRLAAEPAQIALALVRLIGLVLTLEAVMELFEENGEMGASTARLLSSLLVIAGCTLLWRLARLIHRAPREPRPADDAAIASPEQPRDRLDFATPISRVLYAFALAAGLTALTGYVMLAREIFSDLLLSLAVGAMAIYLHRTVKLVLAALSAGPLRPWRRALHFVPMASGLLLLVVTGMLIALIWGYRIQEVGDALVALRTGVRFGQVNISAGDVFTFAIVFGLGFVLTRWVQGFLRLAILPEFGMDAGVQSALVTALGYVGVMLAALAAIASTGLDLSSLAFVFGALSVGIGFGLQSVVENFTSGILLLVERPVREGDWIVVGTNEGIVRKIAVRSTRIETFDGHYIIVPNSQLISSAVKNMTFTGGRARVIVEVGVAYGSDYERVRDILLDLANADPHVIADPAPNVWLLNFSDSSVDFRLMCWIDSAMGSGGARSNLRFEIARRFAEEGIEIPFPQRDLHVRTMPADLAGSDGPAKGDATLA